MDAAAIGGAVAAVLLFVHSGSEGGSRDAFVLMGFDVERAALLAAGLGAALAAAVAGLISANRLTSAGCAMVTLWALFGPTYVTETVRAASNPVLGNFDPVGWVQTAVVLAGTGILIGVAVGILGAQVRSGSAQVVRGLAHAWTARDLRAIPRTRLVIAMLLLAMALVGVPVLGQLLNYGPDSLMLSGGPAGVPIVGNGPAASNLPTPSFGATAQPVQTGATALPVQTGSTAPTPIPSQSATWPWIAWRPSGTGTVLEQTLPGPWIGGTSSVHFSIYLPAQYAAGTRRYPVIYEIPTPLSLYESAVAIRPMLDRLIAGGQIPASIVVFVSSGGGPFGDSECIDAAGGAEWYDTFVATTLVQYLDANFRTIASAPARTLVGFSQGGFCAANVLLHHPSVFHQAISFSGYFYAAPMLGLPPAAQAPYGGDRALQLRNSPMLTAADVPIALRGRIMLALIGDPAAAFLGTQLNDFAALTRRLGYAVTVFDTPLGHSWLAVRELMPSALAAIGARQATEGVFLPAESSRPGPRSLP